MFQIVTVVKTRESKKSMRYKKIKRLISDINWRGDAKGAITDFKMMSAW